MKRNIFLSLLLVGLLLSASSGLYAESLVQGEPADYLIICNQGCVDELNYYVTQKTSEGYMPRVFTAQDIYANYEGEQDCERIRNFIIDAFNSWPVSYVLLVGSLDANIIPSGPPSGDITEKDMYYALLDGGDMYKDVFVGRLPSGNCNEVLLISTQWADYSNRGFSRNEFCLTGQAVSFVSENNWDEIGWDEIDINAEYDEFEPEDVINTMNAGNGLVNWGGHGNWEGWSVSFTPYFDYEDEDAYDMSNVGKQSYINAIVSCYTGAFNLPESIAEEFVKGPVPPRGGGGAIGYFGANYVVSESQAISSQNSFYSNIQNSYLRNGNAKPGEASHLATNGFEVWYYNLLGDPTVKMNLLPLIPDEQAPEITSVQLSDNNILPGERVDIAINALDNDQVGLVNVTIILPDLTQIEEELFGNGSDVYTVSMQSSDTAQLGNYQTRVKAKDISQNEVEVVGPNFKVIPDTEPPVITGVTFTPNPVYQNQRVHINIHSTDNAPPWGRESWCDITKPDGETVYGVGNYSYFEDTDQVGTYNVVAYAEDYSGNEAIPFSTSFEVIADENYPVIYDAWVSDDFLPNIIFKEQNIIESVDTPGTRVFLYEEADDAENYQMFLTAWAEVTKPDLSVESVVEFIWQGYSYERAFHHDYIVDQIGNYSIVYYIQDLSGNTTQSQPVPFVVTGNNLPPVIILPPEIANNNNTANAPAGETLSFIVLAVDPNEDPVTLRVYQEDIPSSYTFNQTTGEFSWTPDLTEVGVYSITFEAKDNHPDDVGVYETVTIFVWIPSIPNPPSNLIATTVSSSQINLSWQDNSNNEDGFKIERKLEGGTYQQIDTVGQDITTYSDRGLQPETTYYYRVRSYNAYGNSSYSNEVSARTFREGAPRIIRAQPKAYTL